MTRLGAGRSWVQVPVEVRDIEVHPVSYLMVTSIDGKVNECSHSSTRPVCINGVDRDNLNFFTHFYITTANCYHRHAMIKAFFHLQTACSPSSHVQWDLVTTA